MMQVVWSADSKVQRTVELFDEMGMQLVCDGSGFRALTSPAATAGAALGGLLRAGLRPSGLKGSGPSDPTEVGEDNERAWGQRSGRFFGVVR